MSLMFAELYFDVVLFIDGFKWINELELEQVLQIFLLFSLYFSSLNLKYLNLTKMELTRFAMKLFIYSCWIYLRRFLRLFMHLSM